MRKPAPKAGLAINFFMPEFKPAMAPEKQESEKKLYPEYRIGNGLVNLYEEKSKIAPEELKKAFPGQKLLAVDFYLQDAEDGEEISGGYIVEDVENIDHHAPTPEMAKFISSANLAIKRVSESGPCKPDTTVIVNHTDCDSVLSSAILRGELAPEKKFGDAAIAADHTGEENAIADLLQAIDKKRDLDFSIRNLKLFLDGQEIDSEAKKMLERRLADREKIKELVENGEFSFTDEGVANITMEEKVDGGLVPALLPEAKAIVLGSRMPDGQQKKGEWEIKVRIGLAAPKGLSLLDLDLPDFGGRWNAGSTKRSGGTNFNAAEYAKIIGDKLDKISYEHGKESKKRKPGGRLMSGFRKKAIEDFQEGGMSMAVRKEIERLVPKGSFIVSCPISILKDINEVKEIERKPREGFFYSAGWSGSYHDAHYTPVLVAWARGSHKMRRARHMMREARAWYESMEKKDSAQARFEARRQVREGD